MYENLRKQNAAYEAEQVEKFTRELAVVNCGNALNSWYYTDRMTPTVKTAVEKLHSLDMIPDELQAKIIKKYQREIHKHTEQRERKLNAAENAEEVNHFDIVVTWVKSATWGYNPHAEVYSTNRRTDGKASGCGYDKESAAICEAFNKNPEIMRILYNHAEKELPFSYCVYETAGIPRFDGGCGVSCFYKVFEECGYEFKQIASGKTYDCYTITKVKEG